MGRDKRNRQPSECRLVPITLRRGFTFYLNKTQKGQDDDLSAVNLFGYIRVVCFMSIIILTRIVLFDFYFFNHKSILWGDIFFDLKYSLWGETKETRQPSEPRYAPRAFYLS